MILTSWGTAARVMNELAARPIEVCESIRDYCKGYSLPEYFASPALSRHVICQNSPKTMSLYFRNVDLIRQELDALNDQWKDADKCYHFQTDPPHVLFNLNCPEVLESRVRDILSRHTNPEVDNPQ